MERCLGGSARVQAARGPHFFGLHAVFLFFTVGVSVFGFLLAIATVWIEAGAGSWLMCGFAASEHFADRRGFAFLVGFIRALLARCHPAGGVSWSLRKDAFGYTSLCGREVLALRSGASIDHGGEGERDHGVGGRTAVDPFSAGLGARDRVHLVGRRAFDRQVDRGRFAAFFFFLGCRGCVRDENPLSERARCVRVDRDALRAGRRRGRHRRRRAPEGRLVRRGRPMCERGTAPGEQDRHPQPCDTTTCPMLRP